MAILRVWSVDLHAYIVYTYVHVETSLLRFIELSSFLTLISRELRKIFGTKKIVRNYYFV